MKTKEQAQLHFAKGALFENLMIAELMKNSLMREFAASVASLPFESTASEKKFKALIVDIGLMTYGELLEQRLVFLPLYYAYSLAGGI